MIQKTLILVGPGGIGKSPLDEILKNDVVHIDPYRLRKDGPRKAKSDVFYANPRLRDELILTYNKVGLSFTSLSDKVQWCPNTMTLLLKVRTEWQVLFMAGLVGEKAKAEIFAPVIPALLSNPIIKNEFGKINMIILNPTDSLDKVDDLKKKTAKNCEDRGDDIASIKNRVDYIDEEIDAWKEMIQLGATEVKNWPFPESIYKQNKNENLIQAKQKLIEINNELASFFMTDSEIKSL